MTRIPTLLVTLATSLVLGLGACASQNKKVEGPDPDPKEVKEDEPTPDEPTPDEPAPDEPAPEEAAPEEAATEGQS